MEISETGCAAYATVIPILLLAGQVSRRALDHLSVMRLRTRIGWLVLVSWPLAAMLVALQGAAVDGVDGFAASIVTSGAVVAAVGLLTEVVLDLFYSHLLLTGEELRAVR